MTSGVHNPADLTPVLTAIEVNRVLLIDIQATTVDTNANVDAVRAVTDAMGILEETGGTLTTDGTEQDIYINDAPGGVYEPRWFNINFANHTVTESVTIKVYYRNVDGGGWVQDDRQPFVGVPVNLLISVALKTNRFGTRVTVEKIEGTNRDYVWEVTYEA